MINKKDSSDPIDNLEYEKVLEEEIINSYESKFQKDTEPVKNKTKFYRTDCFEMTERFGKIKKNILTNLSFINKTILKYFQNHDLFV